MSNSPLQFLSHTKPLHVFIVDCGKFEGSFALRRRRLVRESLDVLFIGDDWASALDFTNYWVITLRLIALRQTSRLAAWSLLDFDLFHNDSCILLIIRLFSVRSIQDGIVREIGNISYSLLCYHLCLLKRNIILLFDSQSCIYPFLHLDMEGVDMH